MSDSKLPERPSLECLRKLAKNRLAEQHKGIGSCEGYVSDVDALFQELLAKGARATGPPVSQPWGLRTFQLSDPDGNRLTFAQRFE